jgi:hypothetical protein
MDVAKIIGRSPERLTLEERRDIAGKWIALEVYTPETVPLKRIEALGSSVVECIRQLQQRGLNPREFEFVAV